MSTSRHFTPELLTQVRRLGAFDVSPCGRWLVTAVAELADDGKTYDTNLYRLDLEAPESGLVALTGTSRKKARPRFAPDDGPPLPISNPHDRPIEKTKSDANCASPISSALFERMAEE